MSKILTMNQLQKRGFSLASRCPLCKEAEETMEHLLIHCPKIWSMWTILFNLSGGGWVCPFLVNDLILGWPSLPWGKKETKPWRAVPLCPMWAIWKERSRVVFEDDCFSYTRLKSYFVRFLCSWASLIHDVDYSFVKCIICIL